VISAVVVSAAFPSDGKGCRARRGMSLSRAMRWAVLALPMLTAAAAAGNARAPLGDPLILNIGLNCQWQQRCMSGQHRAMKRALKYVRKEQPASWRIEMCNRNAARSRYRVDWVGFDNCVRNGALRPAPTPARIIIISKKRPRRFTATSTPLPSPPGERGR
jgi:hypothetical protein